ncbi:MAG: family glycosyltransferase, 4-amino-4-deoxy-L-arabinose transferase [Flavipsychrobacter sp.]|nr:family glycosyltransferase, 4-amino-4-deoxy-L-arabinose transferase [Flavipsychrobacter sp.]
MPKVPFWVFIVVALLYLTAIRIDTMDIDASQYAEMSREMLKKGDYLHLYDRGIEYLDKPPFLFWVSAASMRVFGVNNFAYKFPSILFALLAVFSTYRLGKLLYGEVTGRMAALVLASCQGMFLMTNDVRCDTILMAWVVTGIWLVQEWVLNKKFVYLMGGCAAFAFGMMTKGPIALMVPVFCFASDWILKGQWRNFFKAAYIPGLILIAILLIPMSIGLYEQFDLHPEKLVNGKTGNSGLRFFYWSQSFGRITGESPWKNGADISFLLVNMLWSFLPWIFLFIPALFINVATLIRQKFRLQPQQEWITTGGFLITYLALGMSAYQLPHYIFIVFPLAAIVTAKLLYDIIEEKKYVGLYNFMRRFQFVISCLLLLVALLLLVVVFPAHPFFIVLWIVCFCGWLFLALRRSLTGRIFWVSASAMIIANIFLNNHVYPSLLQYQVGSQLGKYIYSLHLKGDDVAQFKMEDPINCIHFYAQDFVTGVDTVTDVHKKKYIVTMDKGLNILNEHQIAYDVMKEGRLFKVSELTPEFLNPKTRDKATRMYYLLKLK